MHYHWTMMVPLDILCFVIEVLLLILWPPLVAAIAAWLVIRRIERKIEEAYRASSGIPWERRYQPFNWDGEDDEARLSADGTLLQCPGTNIRSSVCRTPTAKGEDIRRGPSPLTPRSAQTLRRGWYRGDGRTILQRLAKYRPMWLRLPSSKPETRATKSH
jgi:hypothetical protein